MDEVGDDEKVVNVVGFFDYTDFVVKAFMNFFFRLVFGFIEVVDPVEVFQPLFAEINEIVEPAGKGGG